MSVGHSSNLLKAHGSVLLNLMASEKRAQAILIDERSFPSWRLSNTQSENLKSLLLGIFSPLQGFMDSRDYQAVQEARRLSHGSLWPSPIVLEVDANRAEALKKGSLLALKEADGCFRALLHIREKYEVARENEITWHLGGEVEGVMPYPDLDLDFTPEYFRSLAEEKKWRRIIAVRDTQLLSPSQREFVRKSMDDNRAGLLIFSNLESTVRKFDPLTELAKLRRCGGDFPKEEYLCKVFSFESSNNSERDLLRTAIVCKNFGCKFLIDDPSGVGDNLLQSFEDELGISLLR